MPDITGAIHGGPQLGPWACLGVMVIVVLVTMAIVMRRRP